MNQIDDWFPQNQNKKGILMREADGIGSKEEKSWREWSSWSWVDIDMRTLPSFMGLLGIGSPCRACVGKAKTEDLLKTNRKPKTGPKENRRSRFKTVFREVYYNFIYYLFFFYHFCLIFLFRVYFVFFF